MAYPVQEMQHISENCGRDGIRLNQREELAAPKLAGEPTEGWNQSGVRTPLGHPHIRAREGALLTGAEVHPLLLGLLVRGEGALGAGKPHGSFKPSPETRDQINMPMQEGRVPGSQGNRGPLQSVLLFPQDRPSAAPGTEPASILFRPRACSVGETEPHGDSLLPHHSANPAPSPGYR